MIGPFLLSTLIFALASDGRSDDETTSEQAWIERFEEVDQLRKKYGIPPLSAQERMALLLGRPNHSGYAIQGEAYHQDDHGNYEIVIVVYRPHFLCLIDSDGKERRLWNWRKYYTSDGDVSLWKSSEPHMAEWVSERIGRITQGLAKRIYVYASPSSIINGERMSQREIEAVLGPNPKTPP